MVNSSLTVTPTDPEELRNNDNQGIPSAQQESQTNDSPTQPTTNQRQDTVSQLVTLDQVLNTNNNPQATTNDQTQDNVSDYDDYDTEEIKLVQPAPIQENRRGRGRSKK